MNKLLPLLLVEDNEDDVFFMQRAFEAAQISNPIQIARDGQEAIDYCSGAGKFADRAKYPLPEMMLLDLKMPRKNGLEVIQWIRDQPALRHLVIVILTSSRELSDIERAYQLGVNSFLLKPSSTHTLAEMMGALKLYWLTHNEFPIARNQNG